MTQHRDRIENIHGWTRRSRGVQALGGIDPATRAVVMPIHLATTFERDPDNGYSSGFVYGRADNETVREAEAVISMLEGAESTMMFGSGMAAAAALFMSLRPGDHVIVPRVMYWGLRNWLLTEATAWGLDVTLVDQDDLAAVSAAIRPGETRLVWAETPANPLWNITDLAAIARLAHQAGALVAVDSTAASPVVTRPLEHGVDIVMHSATKYLNGHSDAIAGSLSTADPAHPLWARITQTRKNVGAVLGPFEAFLLIRGMRTLDVRVRAACMGAHDLAMRLRDHPDVSVVLYPGLQEHPGHAVAARQMEGFGGMLSVRIKAGESAAVRAAAAVKLWKRATSLGGVESLIEHRASIEGAGSPCPTDLLRLSTGLEDTDDLFADLDRAIRAAA